MTLIIFDVDGTLVQSIDKADSRCFAATYESLYQKPFPTIDWRRYPHVTDTTIFQTVIQEHFDRNATSEEMKIFEAIYIQQLKQNRVEKPSHFFEIPGASALVNRLLKEEQYLPVIATGGWQNPAHVKLQHIQIPSETMLISGADDKTTREAIIGEVLDLAYAMHQDFQKIVYIGDEIWDVVTTRNLQMDFLGIRRNNDAEMLTQIGAKQVLPHFLDQELFLQAVSEATPPTETASVL